MVRPADGSEYLPPLLAVVALFVLLLARVYGPRATALLSGPVAGILLILLVVVLWTASSVAIQLVFETAHFRKPFFLTYASACLMVVYLPFYPDRVRDLLALAMEQLPVLERMPLPRKLSPRRARYSQLGAAQAAESAATGSTIFRKGRKAAAEAAAPLEVPLGTSESLLVALRMGTLWFALNLTFNVGLQLSSVSSVTIISASSSLWTLVIAALRERKQPSLGRVVAVLLTFGGVLLVMLVGTKRRHVDTGMRLWGDCAALVSAVTYGLYAVQLRAEVRSEAVLPMPLLFGLIGLACALLLWPWLLILHMAGLELFGWPSRAAALAIVANALVGTVLSNMLLARAMLLASPLLATVGLSLAIPLAMLSDVVRERITHFSPPLVLGSLAVWAGFLALGASDWLESRRLRATAVAAAES